MEFALRQVIIYTATHRQTMPARKRQAERLGKALPPSNLIVLASSILLILLRNDPHFVEDVLAFAVTFAPSSASFFALKSTFSDENLSCFGGAAVALVVFLLCRAFLQLSHELISFAIPLIFTMIFLPILRSRWGISGHVTAAILVSTLLTLIDLRFALFYILTLLLAWSRLELRAHNISQILFGALLGLAVPLIYFLLA